MTAAAGPRHIYVHVPFCARRCSYCDFAIAVRRTVPVDEYLAALAGELRVRLGESRARTRIDTLYFGGGTPSQLGPDGVARAIELFTSWFDWSSAAEITLEVNPEDVTRDAVRAWRDAGITRLSLGAQSFEPRVLTWMHRTHDAGQIMLAIETLRDAGFASWSFDLIFAVPSALGRDWRRDVERALAADPPHISLYGLTVEPGTPLAKWAARGEAEPADEDRYGDEFRHAHTALEAHGLQHYEVSNFARPGHRARHNSAYWSGVPYLGVGPSAHGHADGERRWNRREYAEWAAAVARGEDPLAGRESLGIQERRTESVYLGLRTIDGLMMESADRPHVAAWQAAGWVQRLGDRVRCTAEGWLRLDSLAATLTRARDLT
jgi:oxygen-independent coproporphyrinogen III oxidase